METTLSKVRVTGGSLNGAEDQQLVDEVMGSSDYNLGESSESAENTADLTGGHDSVSSPMSIRNATNEGVEDNESAMEGEAESATSFEEVDGWQPRVATESDAEAEPVLDASFGSIDPANGQEFFGALLPLLGTVVKAAAPTLIGAAAQYAPKIVKTVLGGKKPKLPASILGTLKSFNVPSGILKMLESGEYSDDFADVESSESAVAADTLQQQIEALEVVIGTDDRVRVNNTTSVPWKRICHLKITAANGRTYLGTGFFIGPRTIVTAGHCVYLHNEGGWAKNIVVSPARNAASTPFNSFTSANFRSVRGWVNNRDRNFDYGVILLSKTDSIPASIGSFGFGNLSDASLTSGNLNTAGYPGDKPSGTMWYHGRKAKSLTARTITYDIDTAGGQSGSPVWIKRGDQRIVVGIHTNGASSGNSATRIAAPVFANLQRWRLEGGSL